MSPTRENRRQLRFRVDDASATLYVKGFLTSLGLSRSNKARTAVNLSEGGALILTSTKIPAGTQVVLRIEMEKYEDVIETPGEVRWCFQSARNSGDFYAGIKFKGLAPIEAKKIAKMREWFTSPEYRNRTSARKRSAPPRISSPEWID